MINSRFLLLFTALLTVQSGCVSQQIDDLALENTLIKNPPVADPEPLKDDHKEAKSTQYEVLEGLVAKLSNGHAQLSWSDKKTLAQIMTPPPPRSLSEAALALDILYYINNESLWQSQSFSEVDLYSDENAITAMQNKGQAKLSLEQLSKEKQIDIKAAIQKNPFLQTYTAQSLAFRAIYLNSNATDFNTELTVIIKNNIEPWLMLHQQISPNDPLNKDLDSKPAESDAEQPTIAPSLTLFDDNLQASDEIIEEASKLISANQYLEAVALLKRVPEEDMLYGTAFEKAKEASNLAVKTLRQKAAQAFQAAIPVNDPKTRSAYLTDAKKHLEEALQNYPNADQINTVRKNLEVIEKNLKITEEKISENIDPSSQTL